MRKVLCVLVVLAFASVSWAAVQEWDSEDFAWGPANADLVYYPNGWNNLSTELDGDGLHGGLSADGWENRRWIKRIDSVGMSNLTLTAHGHGHPSHGAGFEVGLSLDGVTWDYVQYVSAPAPSPPIDLVASVSPGFDMNYDNIDSVYIYIKWSNGNNTLVPWYSAYITDVVLSADGTDIYVNDFGTEFQRSVPEPVSMVLLGLGGLLAVRRRRS